MPELIDRYRNRPLQGIGDWVSEEIVASIPRKAEELQVILGRIGDTRMVAVQNVKMEGATGVPARSISVAHDQIVGVLEGLDAAGTQYRKLSGVPEDELPVFPMVCGDKGGIAVKLDRHNAFFNIKLSKKMNQEWAILRPNEVEDVIRALVTAYDRLRSASPEAAEDLPF